MLREIQSNDQRKRPILYRNVSTEIKKKQKRIFESSLRVRILFDDKIEILNHSKQFVKFYKAVSSNLTFQNLSKQNE